MSAVRHDFRSDTVTRPTPAMWDAMNRAEVGDDVYGEDPNVNALQEEVAALLGKEAALYVPSGTMANQVALKAHTQPGEEVIAHHWAHIVRSEGAAGPALSGVQFRLMGDEDGQIDPAEVKAAYQTGENVHFAPTSLICLENTHNFSGGKIMPMERIEAIAGFAAEQGVPMHLDGARMMNACVALDVQPQAMARHFSSTSICFSKGLGAPVGSAIVGTADFINRCKKYRKMFGGSMRQAGILAAGARHALKHHVERLREDHENARLLAEGLRDIPGITLPRGMPQTNMVFLGCDHPKVSLQQLVDALKAQGILIGHATFGHSRLVTHLDVDRQAVEHTVAAVRQALA